MRLDGKVVLITGGGQGLGREYALGFGKEGAKVVVADINYENAQKVIKEIVAKGGKGIAVHVDVSSVSDTNAMAIKAMESFGQIDVLVNNAAIYSGLQPKPFDLWSIEEWDRMFAVNVKGMWLCAKAVVPHMLTKGKGKIINISSATFNAGFPYLLPYVASKGATVAITRCLARELGDRGINVNCIAPGFTMSEASKGMASASEGLVNNVIAMQCLKRSEEPEDLVGAAIFLASDDSNFVTGQTILVDGGLVTQ